jgi:hypothetical protein
MMSRQEVPEDPVDMPITGSFEPPSPVAAFGAQEMKSMAAIIRITKKIPTFLIKTLQN